MLREFHPSASKVYDPGYWGTITLHRNVVSGLLTKLAIHPLSDPDTVAVFDLAIDRLLNAVESLGLLEADADDHYRDSAVIVRAMYDLHVQFLFILHADTPARARMFLDFAKVEIYSVIERFESESLKLSAELQKHPKYQTARANHKAMHDAVKPHFEYAGGNKKGETRPQWHKEQLCQMAEPLGLGPECRVLHKLLSAAVHSSATTLLHDLLPGTSLYYDGWRLTLRVIASIAAYRGVPFEPHEQEVFAQAMSSFF